MNYIVFVCCWYLVLSNKKVRNLEYALGKLVLVFLVEVDGCVENGADLLDVGDQVATSGS